MTSGVGSLARLNDALAEHYRIDRELGAGGMAIDARRVFTDVDETCTKRTRSGSGDGA